MLASTPDWLRPDRLGRAWIVPLLSGGGAMLAIGFLALAFWTGGEQVLDAVRKVGGNGIVAVLGLSLLNYGLRFLRWQLYLTSLGQRVPVTHSLLIYLAGFAFALTPAKAGELFRSVYLARRGVDARTSAAAFLSDRLADLLAVCLLALFSLWSFPGAAPLVICALAVVTMLLLVVWSHRRLQAMADALAGRTGRWQSVALGVVHALIRARACHVPRVMSLAMVLSLLGWGAEALAMSLMLDWMGSAASMGLGLMAYSLGVLGGALTFLPGGLGGAEGTMFAVLSWGGLVPTMAAAAVLLSRVTTLWFSLGVGAVAAISLWVLRGADESVVPS